MKKYIRSLIALLPEKMERKYYEKYFRKEHLKWVKEGSYVPVSNLAKQSLLQDFQCKYNIKIFVETGTYLGDTLYAVYPYFKQLYSIELSQFFYKKAKKRFKKLSKVDLLYGDSGKVLNQLLANVNSAAIFWLDGHYSGGNTALGDKECPVFEELKAIFSSPFEHLIFIDDARLFIGQNDYPTLNEIKNYVDLHRPSYNFLVKDDCIRLLPPT